MLNQPKSIKDLPKEAGTYNIEFDGVSTFLPLFADFDGKAWSFNGSSKMFADMGYSCYYYPNKMEPESNTGPGM